MPLGCRCYSNVVPQGTSFATSDTEARSTFKTSCPKCGGPVYFVRHNGGSVWLDDLGDPWPQHPCFSDDGEDSIAMLFPGISVIGIGTVQRVLSRDWRSRPEFRATCSSFVGNFLVLDSRDAGALPEDGEIVSLSTSNGIDLLHTSHGATHRISYYREQATRRPQVPSIRTTFTTCPQCKEEIHWTEYEAHKLRHRNA